VAREAESQRESSGFFEESRFPGPAEVVRSTAPSGKEDVTKSAEQSEENIIDPMDSYDRFDASHEKRKEGDRANQLRFVKVPTSAGSYYAPGLLAQCWSEVERPLPRDRLSGS